ncbi:MAG: YncE family protein, partial [Chthoniobacterales bacterium]
IAQAPKRQKHSFVRTSSQITATITVGTAPDNVAVSPEGQWVYVAAYVGGTVSIINANTNQLSGNPIMIGNDLDALAVTPDGKQVYTAAYEGPGYFGWIDTDSQKFVRIRDGKLSPFFLCILPNSKRVYGVARTPNSATEKIVVITTGNNKVAHEVVLPKEINEVSAMGLTADGKFLYVGATTLPVNGEVFMVDTATNKFVGQPVQIGSGPGPTAVVISPDDKFAYVANISGNTVLVIKISND